MLPARIPLQVCAARQVLETASLAPPGRRRGSHHPGEKESHHFLFASASPQNETITGSRGSLTLESKLKTELLLKGGDLSVNSTSINIMV